jgi:hypothetical protein
LQGDISVQNSRPEELEVAVHRLEREKDVLQGNLMAGERKGEMLQGVKKECHRAKEELQDQLTASENETPVGAPQRRVVWSDTGLLVGV